MTYGTSNAKYNNSLVSHVIEAKKSMVYVYPYLIDSMNFFGVTKDKALWNAITTKKDGTETINIIPNPETNNYKNSIFKNTFELDPAKQAFQSYSTKDSSRLRGVTAADYQIISLEKEYLQFPDSNDTCPVSVFTPKASFEGKNVCTDKTQPDKNRPNMLTVSFGIDHTTTRCFNWISVGNYDEFIWIRKQGDSEWNRFQSYWKGTEGGVVKNGISRKEFNQEIRYNFHEVTTGENTETVYDTTTVREVVYANPKYKNIFPGSRISYTSHKCILTIPSVSAGNNNKVTYEYLAGRSNSDGTPMEGHVTEIQTFNMYPSSWAPVIYQITDQQGFHWIEYQAWAAAAKVVNDKINSDLAQNPNIIPILLNTGDMTQNGTRINEWLDYYRAGYCLFDHLEQINVVGNNDLGNVDETALGTGDDPGKSNPHFYNICYCYEIPMITSGTNIYCPIFCGNSPKYIPSMYYLDIGGFRLYLGNTEITNTTVKNLYETTPNIYTGLLEVNTNTSSEYNTTKNTSDFSASYEPANRMDLLVGESSYSANHYLYEVLYAWMNNGNSNNKLGIFACHEMPFTVITYDNLLIAKQYSDRSISVAGDSTGLVGSHGNRIYYDKSDKKNLENLMTIRSKGTYWLSRLLENFGIKYCLGGHKHTYACTWPIREYYYYDIVVENNTVTSSKNSLSNGPMPMPATLENDSVSFIVSGNEPVVATEQNQILGTNYSSNYKNLTKFPLVNTKNFTSGTLNGNYSGGGERITSVTEDKFAGNKTYVIYFMLQATGFKLKSNKELPGTLQKFSQIIPESTSNGTTPSKNQIYPMFARIDLVENKYNTGIDIHLMAIKNIVPNDTSSVFNPQTVNSSPPEILYFDNGNIPYGAWKATDRTLDLHI